MGYEISSTDMGKYLEVMASGPQTFENNLALAHDCLELCRQYGKGILLIDIIGLTGQPGAMADYQLAKLIDEWAANKCISKAALYEKETELAAGKFFETAVRNRAINLRVFTDKKEAVKWLMETA